MTQVPNVARSAEHSSDPVFGAAPAMKFCGITRAEDAAAAATLGAAYVGSIFAGGPRVVSAETARVNGDAARAAAEGRGLRSVGVMGTQTPAQIADIAGAGALDVVQLHAQPTAADVDAVRRVFGGAVWAVLSLPGATLPAHAAELFAASDAVVLDAKVPGHAFGGTGVALPWAALVEEIARLRGATALILAGGLTAANVADAIAILAPDVVDVASGIECAPGVKDEARMTAFADAVARTAARDAATRDPLMVR